MLLKILITGVSGLVGGNLAYNYLKTHDVSGIYNNNKIEIPSCNIFHADLTKKEEVTNIKGDFDVIIHCAGPTNLDFIEKHRDYSYQNIYNATDYMLDFAKQRNSFFIFLSTNAIFDGEKGNYTESDTPNPTNYYGELKLLCEKKIRGYKNHCILRIIPYGWNIQNKMCIAEWILSNLRKKHEINGFTDAIFSPILVNNMAKVIEEIFTRKITGTYNLAGTESCSKYEFAMRMAETAGLDKTLIKKAKAVDFFNAKRGLKLDLNMEKLSRTINTKIMGVNEGITEFLKLENEYAKELKNLLK